MLDFKKTEKLFYQPSGKPEIIHIPQMHFLRVEGTGNPNEQDGAYQQALSKLYGVAYALKMSDRKGYTIAGFEPYVVPPLEGFWWLEGMEDMDPTKKDNFHWISVLRLPDFIQAKDVEWAIQTMTEKKKQDHSAIQYYEYEEGLCVQCMHVGSFDEETVTISMMQTYLREQGYEEDWSVNRFHHEIYLNNIHKVSTDKLKTVIRHPIKKSLD